MPRSPEKRIITPRDIPRESANGISRVAGKHCCFPAPSELHVTVARHAAQAFTNAPRGTRPLLAAAFTIRAWSRRTIHQTFQSGARPGAAPASISAAVISACLPESVSRGSLVTEDPREVSPLSRRGDVVFHRQVGRRFLLGRPIFVEDSPSIRSLT